MARKKADPKLYRVRKEWRPDFKEVDRELSDIEANNRYKSGQPAIIDGTPFIWTYMDSEMVRRICSSTTPNRYRKQVDYIEDGMNELSDESFNW